MAIKNNQPMGRQKLRVAKEKDGEMYFSDKSIWKWNV